LNIFSTFLQVNMLNAVTANFLGDNLQCWMQIQSGKGPWASEVSGIVKIGQTMTMVLGIKDEENKFDMVVSPFHASLILVPRLYSAVGRSENGGGGKWQCGGHNLPNPPD
jgi:hypothetical protein